VCASQDWFIGVENTTATNSKIAKIPKLHGTCAAVLGGNRTLFHLDQKRDNCANQCLGLPHMLCKWEYYSLLVQVVLPTKVHWPWRIT